MSDTVNVSHDAQVKQDIAAGGGATGIHIPNTTTTPVESLATMYRAMYHKYTQFENNTEIQSDEGCFYDLLNDIDQVQERADQEGVISKNETVDDINTGTLQYLFLPFFYAKVCGSCPVLVRRLHYLSIANGYMHRYVEKCVKTGVISEVEVEGIVKDNVHKVWYFIVY